MFLLCREHFRYRADIRFKINNLIVFKFYKIDTAENEVVPCVSKIIFDIFDIFDYIDYF